MKNMMNPELEVVRFGAEDVIATSGVVSKYNISAGSYYIGSPPLSPFESVPQPDVAYQAHACDNEASHFHVLSQNNCEGNYFGMEFAADGINKVLLPHNVYYFANEDVSEDGFYFLNNNNRWVFCPDSGK